MTEIEKTRVLDLAAGQSSGVRRALMDSADLSLNEQREIVTSLGGIMCQCVIPKALAPAGLCLLCGVEGPFYREAADWERKKNINGKTNGIVGKYTRVDWHAEFKNMPDEVDWLFPPILERGTINALFGKPGTGKSLLALNMVLDLVRDGKTVTYFDDENRITDIVERLRDFGCRNADELENFHMYSFAGLPPLDTAEGGEHLTALAEWHGSDLVVLDTTTRMVSGDENQANTFLQLYRCSLVPLKSRGMTVLRIDHPGKDDHRGQRGSSAKAGDVDTIWRLFYEEDGMLALEREKSRSGHGDRWIKVKRTPGPPLSHDWYSMEYMPAVNDDVVKWAEAFDNAGVPLDAGRPELRKYIKDKAPDFQFKDIGASTTLLWLVCKYRKSRIKP